VEKWIIDTSEGEFYKARAEDGGFVFLTTKRISESSGGITLTEAHEKARLSVPMLFLFKGVIKKVLLKDSNDIKSAVDQDRPTTGSGGRLSVLRGLISGRDIYRLLLTGLAAVCV
jgi:hypothetical protein